ncbi:bifunctional aspartate kinase/homoserine dehydrogenase I [Saprospiraceae bacterium]|nr:bifunctional aspartate kinase/homoserine dehydrogenase I [Saprospiraceae bacterium]
MKVLKFGGTSVANVKELKQVKAIITNSYDDNTSLYVVVSAFSGITDLLIKMTDLAQENLDYKPLFKEFKTKANSVAAELLSDKQYEIVKSDLEENHNVLNNLLSGVQLIQEASIRTKDYILSFGERNCAFILSQFLKEQGYDAVYIDARKYIKTDNSYGAARVNFEETNKLIRESLSDKKKIYIITGFIGSDLSSGRTTTLGRGGSDYTAAIMAAAINAEVLEIWTDVDGVLTSDPRKVKNAYSIKELSYAEAMEMSHFGAKVLYSPTIRPVREKAIRIKIKNTFNPTHPGTLIHDETDKTTKSISGVSAISNISLVTIEGSGMQGVSGIASKMFASLANKEINIIMITQASSEHSITVAIMQDDSKVAHDCLSDTFSFEIERKLIDPIKLISDNALIAIIGENMKNSPGVAGTLFNTLGINGVNIDAIAQGSSELNISFAIEQKSLIKAMNAIHDAFFLSQYKTVHVYMIGIGLIGNTLLEQIQKNLESIKNDSSVNLVINGLSNSKKMILSEEDIEIKSYKNTLANEGQKADIESFIDQMIAHNHAHTIFIDSTANALVTDYYLKILSHNIAISTPNKIGLSSSMDNYKAIKAAVHKHKVPYNFETNVGAGLPVISTLDGLINSGDKIHKIEAVLSGSVSYIFNNFNSDTVFHDVIKEAQDLGYTEPDPREDLSGNDVRRKLLILARETGLEIEASEINILNFLPDGVMEADSVDTFYKLVKEKNDYFKTLITEAEEEDKRLRFIATLENGKGKISLQKVDSSNPFYSLSGSDNMITFTTKRYYKTPLLIRGPGAGADVTAAGVLAEIINTSKII